MISGGPNIETDGLAMNLDAGSLKSYIGSGTSVIDLSGNNFNGTFINGVSYSSDNGGVFDFDGTDSYISLGSAADIINVNTISLECWIKSSDDGTGSDTHAIFLGTRYSYNLQLNRHGTGTTLGALIATNPSANLTISGGSTNIFDQNWHHCVLTFDAGIVKIYLDGENIITNTTRDGEPLRTNTNNFGIGGDTGTRHFYGKIGCPKIYHKVLTHDEVISNYNQQKYRFL